MLREQQKLVEENHNLIYHMLKQQHMSEDDYYDIAAIGLCRAAIGYKPDKGAFSTFACHCIKRALQTEIKAENRKIRRGERTVLYYNALKDPETEFIEFFEDEATDPEKDAVNRVLVAQLMPQLKSRERQIVVMIANGIKWREICLALGISNATVGATLRRIRNRIEAEGR